MKKLSLFGAIVFTFGAFGAFTPIATAPINYYGIPVMEKGAILTSNGTQNGKQLACPDGETWIADSSEASGLKCGSAGGAGGGILDEQRIYSNTSGGTGSYVTIYTSPVYTVPVGGKIRVTLTGFTYANGEKTGAASDSSCAGLGSLESSFQVNALSGSETGSLSHTVGVTSISFLNIFKGRMAFFAGSCILNSTLPANFAMDLEDTSGNGQISFTLTWNREAEYDLVNTALTSSFSTRAILKVEQI
jgi:hypothetical protein